MYTKRLLTDAQEDQLKNMIEDRKDNREIKDFFKSTYRIDLTSYKLNYARSTSKLTPKVQVTTKTSKSKRAYHRRQPLGGGTAAPSEDNIKSLVDQLRAELESYSKFVINKIRIELVKAIAEARKKRIDIGEDVEEFKAPEEDGAAA